MPSSLSFRFSLFSFSTPTKSLLTNAIAAADAGAVLFFCFHCCGSNELLFEETRAEKLCFHFVYIKKIRVASLRELLSPCFSAY